MKSLIIIEVEHGDTTDGVSECLFDMGIGAALDPQTDDQWPTASDGASWPRVIPGGINYRVTDYSVRVDLPECFSLTGEIPADSVEQIRESTQAILDMLDEKPTWNMGCNHFDAMNDPNHDCSTWGDEDERVTCEGCGESHDHCICDPLGNEADALRDEWRGEPGSPFDRGEPVYNREGYFRQGF